MPSLILMKSPGGTPAGQHFPLNADTMVIGRDAEQCQIAIPNSAVSRRHAIINRSGGQFFIEDLGSRNGTFVNQQKVISPTALKNEDRVKICDFLFRFRDEKVAMPLDEPEDEEGGEGLTTVQGSVNRDAAQEFLQVQPSDRLRALLTISTGLSKTLEINQLLPQIADTLFDVFKQADRCFVILLDEQGRLIPKAVKSRRPMGDDIRFSKTIVRKCLESATSYLSEDAASDLSLGPAQSIAEFRIRSVMCVPLVTAEGKRLGAIQLDTQDAAKKFNKQDDLNLLTVVANLATIAIEKAQSLLALLAREKEQKEIEIARKVQVGFLPKIYPPLDGYEFFAFYSAAQSVGGDYYDFISLPHGRVAVVLGDVAGKGVAAALLMAKLSAEVRFCILTQPDPAKAMTLLNEQLIRGGIGDRFVTMVVCVIDPQAHQLTFVNGGHINPLKISSGGAQFGEVVTNAESGVPVGLVPGFEYTAKSVSLEHNESILLNTDGVTDAESPDGVRFESAGIHRALQAAHTQATDGRPHGVGDRVIRAMQRHANGRAQFDDIALVCFGRTDPGAPTGSHLVPRLEE